MKKILVIGFVRSGTHFIKNYYYKMLNYKVKILSQNKKIYHGLKKGDIFIYKNKKFFIYTPWKKKNFTFIKKNILLKKNILSTHHFDENLFKIFKDFQIFVTIRKPIKTIFSCLSYSTKKNVRSYNSNYKIFDINKLVKNEKIIKKHINDYEKFYKNVNKSKSKFYLIDYKKNLKTLNFLENKNTKKLIKNKLHSAPKNLKLEKKITKEYNFSKLNLIYKSLLKKTIFFDTE